MWLIEDTRTGWQKFVSKILKAGPIPKHVAVIMDGNRRWSRKNGHSLAKGYAEGSKKLDEVVKWAYELGIKEVTAYAFSIENFKRSEAECNIVFQILKNKLDDDTPPELQDGKKQTLITFRLVGDWSLIPDPLSQSAAEAMFNSRFETDIILNMAIAYTGRHEIAQAAETLRNGVNAGKLKMDDVSEFLLSQTCQILPTNPVDLLIRTSNTHRLSDFLLWQTSYSVLHFVEDEWPDLSFWDLCHGIFKFQRHQKLLKQFQNNSIFENESDKDNSHILKGFMNCLIEKYWTQIKEYSGR